MSIFNYKQQEVKNERIFNFQFVMHENEDFPLFSNLTLIKNIIRAAAYFFIITNLRRTLVLLFHPQTNTTSRSKRDT